MSSDAEGAPPPLSGRSSRPPAHDRTAASSSTSSTRTARTEVGRVGRPHGLDGSFYVVRPEPEVFVHGLATSLGKVVRLAGTADRPIVRLAGVETREAAEALRGEPILAEVALEEDELVAADLVGMAVVDGEVEVGVVARVVAYPSCEVLEVGDLLVPLVSDAVRDIDMAAGRIDVDLRFLGAG